MSHPTAPFQWSTELAFNRIGSLRSEDTDEPYRIVETMSIKLLRAIRRIVERFRDRNTWRKYFGTDYEHVGDSIEHLDFRRRHHQRKLRIACPPSRENPLEIFHIQSKREEVLPKLESDAEEVGVGTATCLRKET